MKWIKNTDDKRDAILTFALIGFIVVIFKLLVSGGSFLIGGNTYTFGEITAAEIGAILTPTLGAYVARRYTDKKFKVEVKLNDENEDA